MEQSTNNALVETQTAEIIINEDVSKPMDIFFNMADFEKAQRIAKMIAHSNFIPDRYRGNIGDCAIALDIAQRLQMSPITILQELYIVNGSPGYSSKFLIALINGRGGFAQDLEFEETATTCFAWTINKQGTKLTGPTVSMDMAKKEGWLDKKGSKWQTMPQVMLIYRAASFFAKKYCSNLLMGLRPIDEIEDINSSIEKDITPKTNVNEKIKNDNSNNDRQAKLREAIQGTNDVKPI